MKLSLSSCWNSHRHEDGYSMIEEIKALGFEQVELSHGIRLSLIPGILKAVDEGSIGVSSVHNFCPLPPGIMGAAPNLYQPTTMRHPEVNLWLQHTLKTIDFAHRVGAKLVVVHSGSVRTGWFDGLRKAEERLEGELSESERQQLLEKSLSKLRKKKTRFMENLVTNLEKVIPRAKERGIKLGLENREGFVEMPMDEDWPEYLKELGEPETVGYWHDCGHAELKSQMGIIPHRKLFEDNRDRQFGFHLHDVSEDWKDHQIPGSGLIDWTMVQEQFRAEDIFVMEMSPRIRSEGIREGKAFLENLLANAPQLQK